MTTNPSLLFVNGLGDQLIALPAVRALAKLFPDRIQLMLGEGNYRFFFADAALPAKEPVRIWWKDGDTTVVDVDRVANESTPSDLFISLSTAVYPSFLALAERLGAKRTVGFFDCYSERVPWLEMNMFDLIFSIPQHFDPSLRLDDFSAPPKFEPSAERAAARAVERAPGEKLLFLHAETSFDQKAWTAEHFSWVLTRFLEQHPEYRIVDCGKDPYPLSLGPYRNQLTHLDEHLQLAMAAMQYADLFLGVDSCFLHAADLYRVPSVALFGPTRWQEWGLRLTPHGRHISGDGSMAAIRRERVLDSLLELAYYQAALDRRQIA